MLGNVDPYGFHAPIANSQVRFSAHGVLKVTLRPNGYDWQWQSIPRISTATPDRTSATHELGEQRAAP